MLRDEAGGEFGLEDLKYHARFEEEILGPTEQTSIQFVNDLDSPSRR